MSHSIHIVDDDHAVLDSLTFMLSTAGFDTVAHESAESFLDVLDTLERGCVVTDVRMPGMSGIDLLRKVQESGKAVEVIVVTGHGDVSMAVEAMKLGAVDFLEKPYDEESLVSAVGEACRRQTDASEQAVFKAKARERCQSLSRREREVMDSLVAGKQNKETARDLGISPRTVEVYRSNVMTKMQASSLSELVRMSLAADLDAPSG